MRVELTKKNGKYYIDIIKPWEDRFCGDIFTASNGWLLYSAMCPAIYIDRKYFAVNGYSVRRDKQIGLGHSLNYKIHPFPCEIPKDVYYGIKQLLTEYKASLEL